MVLGPASVDWAKRKTIRLPKLALLSRMPAQRSACQQVAVLIAIASFSQKSQAAADERIIQRFVSLAQSRPRCRRRGPGLTLQQISP